jgi:DNA polymerase-3 subunit beta
MKIQLLKENLQQAVGMVGRFTAQKTQLPILAQMAIRAGEGGIFISGTDLDMGIRLRVGGKVLEGGEIGVPAKLIGELVGVLPLGTVELETSKQMGLAVRAGKIQAKLQGVSLADFPALEEPGAGKAEVGEFAVEGMVESLERVEFAVSRDESRPVLTGVLWDLMRGRLVATDGYRLSVVEQPAYKVGKLKGVAEQLLIAGIFLREGVRVAQELSEKKMAITYLPDKKQLYLRAGDALVVGRVLEGEYPKYEAIMPASFEIEVQADRQELLQAVKAAAIFARDSAHIIRFKFEEKTLLVSANAPQVGENQVEVEIEPLKAGKLAMAFNGRYLVDCLTHNKAERVVIGANEALKPGVFKEFKNEEYQHVIMPVRVREGEGEVSSEQ